MEERNFTYAELFHEGARRLAGIPDGELDARLLLEEVCGTDLTTLLAAPETPVGEAAARTYFEYIARREKREPLAYIIGHQEFMGLPFFVDRNVLIPNPDTETLAELALPYLSPGMRILDLCTGSGCILLSLLARSQETTGAGTDLSPSALAVAERNSRALGLTERAAFWEGDLFAAVPAGTEPFDVIVSNPPYIAEGVIGTLEDEVRVHEPHMALSGGADGLVFYRRILRDAPRYLKTCGMVLLEIGYDQEEAVTAMLRSHGFADVCMTKDLNGLPRVVSGRKA